jgi:hypothetical protein
MNNWVYIVTGLSLLLLAYLLWNEARRQNRFGLLWRLLATLFAIVSLACIALPIHYHRINTINELNEAVLLTDGFNNDSVAHFLQSKKKDYPVFTFNEKMISAKQYHATLITNPSIFLSKHFTALHVFGYGLEKETLENLQKQPLIFHSSNIITGIAAINWQRVIKTGNRLTVQGTIINTSSSPKKMILSGFTTTFDSITVAANQQLPFQLTTVPKQLGRMVYTVSVINGKDTIEKEPVPVQVLPGDPLKVLILASSPDFENKFLKNWLAQKGYPVVVRTSISKNKYEKEFANIPPFNVDQVTASLLDRFDITIADAAELSSITKQELSALQLYVQQRGKGLIIKADSAASRSAFYAASFPLIAGSVANGQQMTIGLLNDSSVKLKPLITDAPLFIQPQNGTQPLVIDKENRILVNSTLYGSGKILLSTLSNTFSWVLSGNQENYEALWSTLLNKAAAKKINTESWAASPSLPKVNNPVSLSLQTSNTGVPQAQIEGASVYLTNNTTLPFEWTGTFWPTKQGWQAGVQLNGSIYYWYAFGNNDWKTVDASNKILLTKQYAQTMQAATLSNKQTQTAEEIPFPKIYFFLIFLICCGFLWFENKYYNS